MFNRASYLFHLDNDKITFVFYCKDVTEDIFRKIYNKLVNVTEHHSFTYDTYKVEPDKLNHVLQSFEGVIEVPRIYLDDDGELRVAGTNKWNELSS